MPTDKKILMRGLRRLGGALPLFFIGPIVIHSSFKNQEHPLYIPILGLGIILCIYAIILMAVGLRTIMKSMID
ncbi:hypothetical protein AM493_02890 [Flavobacterium akiainvivens]|uniref:Uncharacterized protein n=1 Tax=Flavobacterium akiainvivens TaxID=1202724 RepID=A0A0M8MGH4_9FLAO|nr:DUF6095 family protein [Flavobacterium akiainvivens]KOS05098.1 hypothetical protein AM493_02890 [Flavobacterium akiainvivens]SFQ51659.1 hypothetical protein SAMN05444144_106226 [Flavobacterium akiainvivens]